MNHDRFRKHGVKSVRYTLLSGVSSSDQGDLSGPEAFDVVIIILRVSHNRDLHTVRVIHENIHGMFQNGSAILKSCIYLIEAELHSFAFAGGDNDHTVFHKHSSFLHPSYNKKDLRQEIRLPRRPYEKSVMITAARKIPSRMEIDAFLRSISNNDATRLPVQAPVPGRGMPTNSISPRNP